MTIKYKCRTKHGGRRFITSKKEKETHINTEITQVKRKIIHEYNIKTVFIKKLKRATYDSSLLSISVTFFQTTVGLFAFDDEIAFFFAHPQNSPLLSSESNLLMIVRMR